MDFFNRLVLKGGKYYDPYIEIDRPKAADPDTAIRIPAKNSMPYRVTSSQKIRFLYRKDTFPMAYELMSREKRVPSSRALLAKPNDIIFANPPYKAIGRNSLKISVKSTALKREASS